VSRIKNNPLDWIGQQEEEEKKARKAKNYRREYTKSSQEGLQENWTRATFIVREDLLEKLKDLAYTIELQLKTK